MKNKEGLGQRGTRLEAECCLGHRGGFTRRKWIGSCGPWTPYCLCSLLKGSFNQRPVAGFCGELWYGGGLEEGRLEAGKSSLVMCFLPRGPFGRGIPNVEQRSKAQGSQFYKSVGGAFAQSLDQEMPPGCQPAGMEAKAVALHVSSGHQPPQ